MHGIELNTLLCDSNNTKLKRAEKSKSHSYVLVLPLSIYRFGRRTDFRG